MQRMVPHWDHIKILDQHGTIEQGAWKLLEMRAGPLPIKWLAEHTEYQQNRLFRDQQKKGPFNRFVHTHNFEQQGESSCTLEDRIEFRLPGPQISLLNQYIEAQLAQTFHFRHQTLLADLAQHNLFTGPPMTILVSGASGILGSRLVPFLRTGGHRVLSLVRRPAKQGFDQVFWDPLKGILDHKDLGGLDAVIHLAGENIGQGRWTSEKKKTIMQSRTMGTDLLATTMARLAPQPKVFLSASAIGYYGHRPEEILNEDSLPGQDFISQVCEAWEKAAQPAMDAGIRTVFLRIGVALTPAGGALQRLLLPCRLGLGGKLGSGRQYVSWMDIDDVIRAVHHCLISPQLAGPVNLTAPLAVTNSELSANLAQVLGRPNLCQVPEWLIRLAFGEMAKEIPLASTQVIPKKLMEAGFSFNQPNLIKALKFLIGRVEPKNL